MIFGIFINIIRLFSGLGTGLSAGASIAGAMAQNKAAMRAMEAQRRLAMPRVVESAPHIPRVKRK